MQKLQWQRIERASAGTKQHLFMGEARTACGLNRRPGGRGVVKKRCGRCVYMAPRKIAKAKPQAPVVFSSLERRCMTPGALRNEEHALQFLDFPPSPWAQAIIKEALR